MGEAKYDPEIKSVLDSFLLKDPKVAPGKMFGYPAYYVNKKLFACVYENGVGLKVPVLLANELLGHPGIVPFTPKGRRKMNEWVQINRGHPEEYLRDADIFQRSVEYVAALAEKG